MTDRIWPVPITRPVLGEAEAAAARRPIESGWLTQGPEVAAFEREFAAYIGARFACAVSNCTSALHLALLAAGVRPNDEVITVSHSFIATANVVRYCGAVPVFVDIEPDSLNMDPRLIERAITRRTKAVLCVHQMGMPCNMEKVLPIAWKHHLRVVEDAACAIGSEVRVNGLWQRIGWPHGDVACFSFHPRKVITTGDGGMITTANEEWDRQFRLWRQHSMDVPDTVRHASGQVIFESYPMLGFNYRMTDVQAAIGREQLKRLPDIIPRRRELAARYARLLHSIPGLRLPQEPDWALTNWQSYWLRLPDGCNQKDVMQSLLDQGVASRRGIMCAHREPAYANAAWSCGAGPGRCGCAKYACQRLHESEQAQDRTIILPLFPQMSDQDQDFVVACIERALANCRIGVAG